MLPQSCKCFKCRQSAQIFAYLVFLLVGRTLCGSACAKRGKGQTSVISDGQQQLEHRHVPPACLLAATYKISGGREFQSAIVPGGGWIAQ